MSLSFTDAAKARQLKEYFNRHGRIYIVVDATSDDVQLPDHLKGDPALRLVLNVRMPQPIHIRDDRVDSDFSFSGVVYACSIPMHTIWGAYLPEGELEQGIIWDDSVPEMIRAIIQAVRSNVTDPDVTAEMNAAVARDEVQPEQPPTPITVIEGGAGKQSTEGEADEKPRRPSHLRIVK